MTQKPEPGEASTLVAVVSRSGVSEGQANMDAVVLVENGKLRQPYAEDNEAAQNTFARQYFSPGKKYRLTFGGGDAGTATVKDSHLGCNNIHAIASLEDGGRIPDSLSGLATDSESLGRKSSSRRAPTDAERMGVMILVSQIYRARGTTRKVLSSAMAINLTATDLDGDGKFELIGNFVTLTKAKARRDLFLIADPAGTMRLPIPGNRVGLAFKPALVNFQSYKLPPEGFDSALEFVDQLDLDGDGVGEVFVQQHGFDAYGYAIYKRSRGIWRQIYATTGDAC